MKKINFSVKHFLMLICLCSCTNQVPVPADMRQPLKGKKVLFFGDSITEGGVILQMITRLSFLHVLDANVFN